MDWKHIEEFLLNSVWGIVILGALGSLLFYIVLNLVGKANRNIRRYWIFYKSGRKTIYEESIKNDEMFSHLKWTTFYYFQLAIIALVFTHGIISSNENALSERFFFVLLCITMVYVAIASWSIVEKVARERIKNSKKNVDNQ